MDTLTVARFLREQIALSGKSQRAIATECGYRNPNMITMFKNGRTKLPLNKVAAFARSLAVDPLFLLRLAMNEYESNAWRVIEEVIGMRALLTEDESALLALVRETGCGRLPLVADPENRAELIAALRSAVRRDEARANAAVATRDALPRNTRSL